jgi:hypothetical protein
LEHYRWNQFRRDDPMIDFKGSRFERGLILRASAGIWPTSISYRQLEEMLKSSASESTIPR